MSKSPVKYVDPFIGVDGAGHCLCGPYLPFGVVRLGPDTHMLPNATHRPTSGYRTDDPIVRFSHTHVSGTGGGSRYGNIGITPYVGKTRLHSDLYERANETASAGFYGVTLRPSDIQVELTVTARVGVHRYTFPEGQSAHLLFDIGAVIQTGTEGEQAYSTGGFVEFISEHELVGRGDFRGGWGHNFSYSVYFYACFDQPMQERLVGNAAEVINGLATDGAHCKASAGFGNVRQVNVRVGISYTSVAKARSSVDRETRGKSFEVVHVQAESIWEDRLNHIAIEGGSDAQRTLFYTLYTRLLCMPSDLGMDDEFPYWHSGVRQFTDLYALWDSVRNANSLLLLVEPEIERDILNCCLDVADHIGWIPDAWITGHSARIQGGISADILFCEALVKGLPGVDYEKALKHMRKHAEIESLDPVLHGRFLKDYRDLGYVSTRVTPSSVSRHLEYSYQDWCIGTLAAHLGHYEIAARCFHDSKKVWNLWREEIGFFAPRHPDGTWDAAFDPTHNQTPKSWLDPYFYEGTSWQWSFNVQHDFAGLIARCDGADGFIRRLDEFFDRGFYFSKETMMHIPYLYIYAGRPDRAAERVWQMLQSQFSTARDGLADNEDMGCQSAWYMWSTLGLYPIMGQDLYLLTTPVFTRAEVKIGSSGKSLVIEAPDASPENRYIVRVTLNGEPLERAWLRHHEIVDGAILNVEVGNLPSTWGQGIIPPSPLADQVADRAE